MMQASGPFAYPTRALPSKVRQSTFGIHAYFAESGKTGTRPCVVRHSQSDAGSDIPTASGLDGM